MRSTLLFFLVLNIYTIFYSFAQDVVLELTLEGNSPEETAMVDKISYTKTFADLNSLKSTAAGVTEQLIDKGYVDAHLSSLKKRDSISYVGVIDLGDFYKFIKIGISDDTKLRDFVRQAGMDVEEN